MKVYKYPLKFIQTNIGDGTITTVMAVVQLPVTFEILDIQKQGDTYFLWARVDEESVSKDILIQMVGTGWDMESKMFYEHISTIHDDNGFVWHFFKVN